jgi:hypothetical protein
MERLSSPLNMGHDQVILAAWIAGIGLLTILALVLIARRAWQRFPLFTAYVVVDLLQTVTLYGLRHQPKAYMYTYWPSELLTAFLGLGVVYEVFKNIFATYAALRKLATTLFQVAVVALVAVGCIVMYTHSPVAGNRYIAAFAVVEESIRIVEVGLLLSLFMFATAFGLHWRQHIFGMALGLGVFTTVALAAITLRAHVGPQTAPLINLARGFSFDFSLLLWLGYLLVPERVPIQATVPQRGQLERWNQAVKELIYQ